MRPPQSRGAAAAGDVGAFEAGAGSGSGFGPAAGPAAGAGLRSRAGSRAGSHSRAGSTSSGLSGALSTALGGSVSGTNRRARRPRTRKSAITDKLGMFDGVFVPTTLNVLSILMFLRFGFILGQAGFLGTLLLLVVSYAINMLTVLSVSAIATNGVVRGGGAYYMISRSLGAEFGGSIGVVFYIGQVLNAGLNVVGFVDPLVSNFGAKSGAILQVLPESARWNFFYQTLLLWVCTGICIVGPALFAKSSRLLFVVLVFATISIPVSAFFVKPYYNDEYHAWYTGFSWHTFVDNLLPHFKKNAAGDEPGKMPDFKQLFGIFFPATAGIFAGASMSGDLRNPSKSIPKGTLGGMLLTLVLYFAVIVTIPSTVSRKLLYHDAEIMRNSNISPYVVIMGEFATSLFSSLMGVIGAAKLLQAISRDNILPWISIFGRGVGDDDNPLLAILFTYVLTQLTILLDIDNIAVFITMAFLMTFVVINLACFLLDVSAAPNFRPSFRYFNPTTAAVGTAASVAAMFAADQLAAAQSVTVSVILFAIIHFWSPPKPWGDVSQTLIYHQVRKYLLLLRQDHVKYWRPQILLLVDDPRSSWSLIKFCSHLKKGGLLILGHVIVAKNFDDEFPEIESQRSAWTRLRDACHIKAFIQISASIDLVWGVRNILLGSGLGGMKPNITVIGFFDENEQLPHIPEFQGISMEQLPTDTCRKEDHLSIQTWVQIVEDLLTMKTNLAVARGFLDLELPMASAFHESDLSNSKGYIDLYPIQMSAKLIGPEGKPSGLSINFDTYTLILQLGAILHTVPAWNKTHNLRLVAFVEYAHEVERETAEVRELLEKLRIPATVLVVPLENNNDVYDQVARGAAAADTYVDEKLANSRWWRELKAARASKRRTSIRIENPRHGRNQGFVIPEGLSLRRGETRLSFHKHQQLGLAQSMQSTRLLSQRHAATIDTDSDDSDGVSDNDFDESPPDSSAIADDEENANGPDVPAFHAPGEDTDADMPRAVCVNPNDVLLNPADDEDGRGHSKVYAGLRSPNIAPQRSAGGADSGAAPGTRKETDLTFNELPAKPQHMILNSLMKSISHDSAVIFTTLPAPARGTYKSPEASEKYHDLLETICEGLPPVILIHAQSLTVTTAL